MSPTPTLPAAALTIVLWLVLTLSSGCAAEGGMTGGPGRVAGDAGDATDAASPHAALEPRLIVIRNATGRDLASVSIQEAGKPFKDAIRIGSISPLTRGGGAIIERQSGSPPLPDAALVMWTDARRVVRRAEVSLRRALGRATGAANEALIFDLQPFDRVRVSVEVVTPSP